MGANLNKVFVVDIEATCWTSEAEQAGRPNEIIEIGICTYNPMTKAIGNGRSYGVKPKFTEVSPFCTALTGWTPEAVEQFGRPIGEVITQVAEDFGFTPNHVWFSCGEYDRVKLSSDRMGGTLFSIYGIDRDQNPFARLRAHMNIKTLFAMKHGLKKEMGMARMIEKIGSTIEGRHHNGMDDSLNIAKLVKHVLS